MTRRGCVWLQDFGDGPLSGPALSVPTTPLPAAVTAVSATAIPDPQADSKDFVLGGSVAGGGSAKGASGAGGGGASAEEAAWNDLDSLQKEARQVCRDGGGGEWSVLGR